MRIKLMVEHKPVTAKTHCDKNVKFYGVSLAIPRFLPLLKILVGFLLVFSVGSQSTVSGGRYIEREKDGERKIKTTLQVSILDRYPYFRG